jgi:hypothetical protein
MTRAEVETRFRESRSNQKTCVACREPAVEGATRCQKHWDDHRARGRKFYRDRVENGLCSRCGMPRNKSKVYCDDCLAQERREYAALKDAVIAGYGGACSCCGESIREFLTIDHIHNDGAQHRRSEKAVGAPLYRRLIGDGFPRDRFQLLCFNCNCGKQQNGGVCPHQQMKTLAMCLTNWQT